MGGLRPLIGRSQSHFAISVDKYLRPTFESPNFIPFMSTITIPIKLLHKATHHIVSVEMSYGQVFRGTLLEAEDNCNVRLANASRTERDGRVQLGLQQVFL